MATGRRVELGRLWDLGRVVGALVIALVVIDGAFRAAFGPDPAFLERRARLSTTEFDRIGRRVASAELHLFADRAQSAAKLVLMAGLSTARVDVDAPLLSKQLCGHHRVLNIGSSGLTFRELQYYLGTLDRTRLRPSVLVLGLHPAWLYGYTSPDAGPANMSELFRFAAAGRDGFKSLARRGLWAGANYIGIHNALTNPFLGVRARLAEAFHLSTDEVFAPTDPDPWSSSIDYPLPRASEAALAAQIANWERAGWFDAARLVPSNPEILAAHQLGSIMPRIADTIVVVLMPEAAAFRVRTPTATVALLRDALENGAPLEWLDLRDAIPDSLFYDNVHLRAGGREQFTKLLAKKIPGQVHCETATE